MGVNVVQPEGDVLGFLFSIFTMANAIGSPTVKCFRFVCGNLTIFPFGKRIVGKLDSWAFLWCIRFQHRRWVYGKLAKQELLFGENSKASSICCSPCCADRPAAADRITSNTCQLRRHRSSTRRGLLLQEIRYSYHILNSPHLSDTYVYPFNAVQL